MAAAPSVRLVFDGLKLTGGSALSICVSPTNRMPAGRSFYRPPGGRLAAVPIRGQPSATLRFRQARYDYPMAGPRNTFVGRWRIASMEMWDELDLLGPAFIEFDSRNGGMFQFVAVSGDIDYRISTEGDEAIIEWSWLGDDDGEETGGRGWAVRDGG